VAITGSEEESMILHGKVRGRTIELTESSGLADGQEVEVSVRTIPAEPRNAGEGLLRTEGALEDDPYWDKIMDDIYQERKSDTRREIVE
jgi:hypothetical protein